MSEQAIIVKVAPLGERVTEVSLAAGSTVKQALEIAGVELNGRSILLNNAGADESTTITTNNSIIALVTKAKGGR